MVNPNVTEIGLSFPRRDGRDISPGDDFLESLALGYAEDLALRAMDNAVHSIRTPVLPNQPEDICADGSNKSNRYVHAA